MSTSGGSTSSIDTIVVSAAALSESTMNMAINRSNVGEVDQIENESIMKQGVVSTPTTTPLSAINQSQTDPFHAAPCGSQSITVTKPPRYSSIYGGGAHSTDFTTSSSVQPLSTVDELQNQNAQLRQQVAHLTELMQRLLEQQPPIQHQPIQQPHIQHQPIPQPHVQQQAVQQPHMPQQSTHNQHYYDRLPVPTFSRDNVEMWFFQLETWFNRRNIANDDAAKYDTLVAALNTNLLTQVAGVLRSVSHGNKYEPLKKAIIANFADSETQQLRKLLAGIPRGTNKPTALLNIMRNTCKNAKAEQLGLIRHFWLDQMPSEVRAVIVGNKANAAQPANITLDDEATLADAIIEALDTRNLNVAQISQVSDGDTIQLAIAELTRKVDGLYQRKGRNRSKNRSNSGSTNDERESHKDHRNPSRTRSTTCIYHRRYGMDARKCRDPCNFHTPSQQKNE